jgi:hypothetical protein
VDVPDLVDSMVEPRAPIPSDDDCETAALMPLYWTIDSKARLFTGVAEGDVTMGDAIDLLEAMEGAKAMSYRKLFDGREATPSMTADELLSVCARIRSYHEQGMMGALALVATAEQTMVFARLLGALASAERPIKLFDTPRQARNWIEEQAKERETF